MAPLPGHARMVPQAINDAAALFRIGHDPIHVEVSEILVVEWRPGHVVAFDQTGNGGGVKDGTAATDHASAKLRKTATVCG